MRHFAAAFLVLLTGLPVQATAASCAGRLLEDAQIIDGPVCIPAQPGRIVVADPTFSLGMALELGLPVVAAPLTGMNGPDLKARAEAAGVADIGSVLEPSLEAVVSARPDMILGSEILAGLLPTLNRIAPTVLISEPDWRRYERLIAQIGGREAKYDALMAALDSRIVQMRPRIPETRVSVLRITPWDFQVYPAGQRAWAPFALLSELGVRRSDYEEQSDDQTVKRPDWEDLGALDGDMLLYIIGGMNNSASSGRLEEVTSNPLWQVLPAVQNGRVWPLDPGTWMEFSGIGSAHKVLDDVERLIIGAP